MNRYYQKAIELKYQGNTHAEIRKALGKRYSEGTIRNWFNTDGLLYIPFLEYQAKQDKFIEEEIRSEFKAQVKYASKVLRTILQRALRKGDLRLALDTVKEQMDRAGVVVIKKSEVKDDTKKDVSTYEQYLEECRRLGIDPESGIPPKAQQILSN